MSAVARISPELKRVDVPDALKMLPAWLCWRSEQYEGEVKSRKIPYWASGGKRTGEQGSAEDRAKLVTFAAALSAAQRLGMTGVGFAPLPDFGITILDFDKCVGPNGEMDPVIEAVTARTFSEYSPSGFGVHAVLRGNLGDHRSQATANSFGLDVFSTKGFITFTGNILPHIDILGLENTVAEADEHVITLCQRRFGSSSPTADSQDFMAGYEPTLGLSDAEIQDALNALDPDMDRDGWVRVGMALHHETEGDGFDLWDAWSSDGAKYPGEEALRQQWDSFERRKGPGRKQVTMASVLAMARDARADDARRVASVEEVQAKAEAAAPAKPTAGPFTPPDFTGKFPIVSAASITAQKPLDWHIKGILPAADLGVLFGASGSGKSFVSLDLAASIALGQPWRGHKVKQGAVIIITAEGGGSYGKRIKAYCQHHGINPDDLPIGIINAAPNIMEADDIGELAASLKAMGGAALLIVDTLAQVTPGANENTSEDMGRALANAMVLRRVTGAMVLLIHHAGKDLSRGARGWSGIKGALDVEIEVTRDEATDAREIRLSKMKDEEDGLRFGFKLETVVLGMDEDGDEYRSCVAVETELRPKAVADSTLRGAGVRRRGPWQLAVLEGAADLAGVAHVRMEQLLDAAMAHVPEPEDGPDRRRDNLVRAIQAMAKERDGPIGIAGQRVIFYE